MSERTCFHLSGSFSRTHSSLVSVKLVRARLHVSWMSRCAPIFSVNSRDCRSVRTSHQMSAGRTTRPPSSSITAPCICPEKPTHAMSPPVGQAFGRNLEVNMQKLDVVYVYADDIVPLI